MKFKVLLFFISTFLFHTIHSYSLIVVDSKTLNSGLKRFLPYGHQSTLVPKSQKMPYTVKLYEVLPNKNFEKLNKERYYEVIYVIDGSGNLNRNNGNNRKELKIQRGSLIAFGAHNGFAIYNNSNKNLRFLSVIIHPPQTNKNIDKTFYSTHLNKILSNRNVDWGNGKSRRVLLKGDGFPISICDTSVNPNSKSRLQYTNHIESCFCISGNGYVEIEGKEKYEITPGTIYSLNENDPHILGAGDEGLRLVSIFSPALSGDEKHHLSPSGYSSYGKPDETRDTNIVSVGQCKKKIATQ